MKDFFVNLWLKMQFDQWEVYFVHSKP